MRFDEGDKVAQDRGCIGSIFLANMKSWAFLFSSPIGLSLYALSWWPRISRAEGKNEMRSSAANEVMSRMNVK